MDGWAHSQSRAKRASRRERCLEAVGAFALEAAADLRLVLAGAGACIPQVSTNEAEVSETEPESGVALVYGTACGVPYTITAVATLSYTCASDAGAQGTYAASALAVDVREPGGEPEDFHAPVDISPVHGEFRVRKPAFASALHAAIERLERRSTGTG